MQAPLIWSGGITFPHNVASGDPLDTSVLLWTRAYPQGTGPDQSVPVCVRYQVYDNEQLKGNVVTKGSAFTSWDVDFTVKVEARNLKPDTWYWYTFNDCTDPSVMSPVGRTRTIASANTPAQKVNGGKPLTFGVFSCSNYPFGFFNAYGYAAKSTDADIMVHLGDYIYEYEEGHLSDRELATLSDYRARLALYRTDESLAYNHQHFPWIQVWDDHEVADNSWKAGTADSNDTASGCKYSPSGTCFSDRKLSAVRAYHEWIPIRQVALDDKLRIWRNFQIGKLLDLTMLDTRNYDRDLTDVYYNTKFVDSIHKGLEQQLLSSKSRGAVWRIIGQQVVFTRLDLLGTLNLDSWDGYTANRKRILDLLYKRKIDNTIILSGDSHANWVSDLAYPNDTATYNPTTGQGAIGVEFAGTAVSSPSPLGQGISPVAADTVSKQLVASNPDLQWSEGSWRGFFTLSLAPSNLTAKQVYYSFFFTRKLMMTESYRFYAMRDLNTTNNEAFVSAEFHVSAGLGAGVTNDHHRHLPMDQHATGMNEVALDEHLDALDPLRHLRDDTLIPPQAPTVVYQTIELSFPPLGRSVKLVVDAGPGCGGIAWPAGEVLSRYLARRGSLAGQRVIELGSGTGLVGLVAGLLNAEEVVITDQEQLVNIMEENIELNNLQDRVRASVLNWGEPLSPNLPQAISLVIAADCVYAEPAFPLLVSTLTDLNNTYPEAEILFCYKKRRKADKRFFGMLKKQFTWEEVADDPERDVYSRQAITLLRLQRIRKL
ncbi:Phospholipase D [Rhizoctonia solani]|uniref:Protein-lysine N-methyltransferase EFM6 n=1 Tax=Rhizoctonia solani TaxID=456999 RepID=A0A0K6GED4_9AGAM|nr:Phospholipase D [Rhizoctonia solani]